MQAKVTTRLHFIPFRTQKIHSLNFKVGTIMYLQWWRGIWTFLLFGDRNMKQCHDFGKISGRVNLHLSCGPSLLSGVCYGGIPFSAMVQGEGLVLPQLVIPFIVDSSSKEACLFLRRGRGWVGGKVGDK